MNCTSREIKIKYTRMLLDISSFNTLSLIIRLNISIIYSIILSFLLHCIETSYFRIIVVSIFLFEVKWSAIYFRKSLTSSSSRIEPLIDSRINILIIIRLMQFDYFHFSNTIFWSIMLSPIKGARWSCLNAKCRSMQSKNTIICSFHCPKLVPVRIEMLLRFAYIESTKR